jgi:cell division protein FtsW
MKTFFGKYFQGDSVIWAVVVILSLISLLAVYSSTGTLAYKYQGGNTTYYFLKHGLFILLGFGMIYIAHALPYKYYSKISILLLYISIPLLALTLILGTSLNEASRWLTLPGLGVTFQTSDLAKLALIMYIARMLAKRQEVIKDFHQGFKPIIIPIILICLLILPANFSTAALIFATSWILMFIGRISYKYLFGLVGLGLIILTLVFTLSNFLPDVGRLGTWKNRVENFISGEAGEDYQVEQAKIAIATGGILGKKPGNSTQRNFLPHPYSDFIYAIIIEEYGIIGGLVILMLYLILLYRTGYIARRSPGEFGTFLAFGLGFSLVFQALINISVAVNLMPVTGQPLPFVSMGGTSMLFTSLAIGIILSVSVNIKKDKENELVAA